MRIQFVNPDGEILETASIEDYDLAIHRALALALEHDCVIDITDDEPYGEHYATVHPDGTVE